MMQMKYLEEREYSRAIGKILANKPLDPDEAHRFISTVSKFESLLDEADSSDALGTEGWKHHLNWE